MAGIEISLTNNSDLIKDALEDQLEQALIAVGMTAETHAKEKCPVDTGRLRNSITFALAGQGANSPTYKANFERYKTKTGKAAIRRKGLKIYTYKGKAPNIGGNEHAVYIGSNVEYAQTIEAGSAKQRARPFLRPAITNHTEEYKNLVKQALSR
jgi:HK97 gp10 family phage protein